MKGNNPFRVAKFKECPYCCREILESRFETHREYCKTQLSFDEGGFKQSSLLKLYETIPETLDRDLSTFLKKWKTVYSNQFNWRTNEIMRGKQITKLKAEKLVEFEIKEQFKSLVIKYRNFPDPIKVFGFFTLTNNGEFQKAISTGYTSIELGSLPTKWVWSIDSLRTPNDFTLKNTYLLTGIAWQIEVDWWLTILKNCELPFGLDGKEVIFYQNSIVQIVNVRGNYAWKQ